MSESRKGKMFEGTSSTKSPHPKPIFQFLSFGLFKLTDGTVPGYYLCRVNKYGVIMYAGHRSRWKYPGLIKKL